MSNSNKQSEQEQFPEVGATAMMTFVVAPASDHASGLNLEGLVDYINKNSDFKINLVFCKDYDEAMEALIQGEAQIGWLGPYAYLEASRSGSIEQFAIGLPKGEKNPNYNSVIIVRKDSKITSLEKIKNARIVIGNRHSTSGYAVPKQDLAEEGINLDNKNEFKEVIRANTHDDAICDIIEGRADVAPVSSVNLKENIRTGNLDLDQIRIIHRSKDIPGAPLVYQKSLPNGVKKHIQGLVLNAHEKIEVGGYGGLMERYVTPEKGREALLESYLYQQWSWKTYTSIIFFVILMGIIIIDLEVKPLELFSNTFTYLVDVIDRMLPPDFSGFFGLMSSMIETIEIAILGTLIAVTLSVPVGLFSARNIAPNFLIFLICRVITVFFRAIPEFIMAMILVIAIGFGAMPGVLALGFHTMGFLAKFYAEDIEHVNSGPIEALNSSGATRAQCISFAIIPQIMPSFIGNNLYILDRNIRMATMLGIVGAGGIGYELQSAFRMFNYPRVSAIVIIIFITIFVIDFLSSAIRKRVQ
jgi:phosphonate ABC transporter permease subunit PhnE